MIINNRSGLIIQFFSLQKPNVAKKQDKLYFFNFGNTNHFKRINNK